MIDAIAEFEGRIAKVDGPTRSGKTEALVRRCARLLERGEEPASILVTVASAAAKRRFAERLARAVGEDLREAAARVRVLLPVEVCASVLADPLAVQLTGRTPRILNDAEYLFFLEDLKTLGQKNQRLSNMLSFFYAQWSNLQDEADWAIPGEETIVLDRARAILRLQGTMLRHEAPYLCAKLLASDEGTPLAQRFAFVLCDDFQNYSYAEQTSLCLCARKQVIVCGDAFRQTEVCSAYPSAKGFANFDRVRQGVKTFSLTAQHGVAVAFALEQGLRAAAEGDAVRADSGAKTAPAAGATKPASSESANALFVEWDDTEQEIASLPAIVAAWCAHNPAARLADIAIAVPTKRWGKLAQRALAHAGVKVSDEGLGRTVAEDPRTPGCHDALTAYAWVSLAADPHDLVAWRIAGGFDHALTNSDIWRGVYDRAFERHIPLIEAIEELAQPGHEADVLRHGDLARIWRAANEARSALAGLRGRALAEASGVAAVPAFAGIVAQLADDASARELRDEIRALLAGTRAFDDPNAVTVALYENLCGIDFPCLVMPGLVDGMIPSRNAFEETKSDAERARTIAHDRARLASCIGKGASCLVASTFAHAEAEVAERAKMKVARIASRDGKRIARLRPSLYLGEPSTVRPCFEQGSEETIERFFARI